MKAGIVPSLDGQIQYKHKKIYSELREALANGTYKPGDQLPTETELVARFEASRPTISRALARLESEKLIFRRAGAGTFVCDPEKVDGLIFGLLIPDLGTTEIFEPICQGMARARLGTNHELLWGMTEDPGAPKNVQAEQLCLSYVKRGVSGVFFAPLELTDDSERVNQQIVRQLDDAGIPIVLLDRDIYEYPRRSHYDLVGIDNRRAGFAITEHLLSVGCRRIVFFARPKSAPTVFMRAEGYRSAIRSRGEAGVDQLVEIGEPSDSMRVQKLLTDLDPDAFLCANDYTAAVLMNTLHSISPTLAAQIRLAAFDDVKYARLLQVPLTTIRQPCQEMGSAAMLAMVDRIARPTAPARDLLVDFELVIRASSTLPQTETATR